MYGFEKQLPRLRIRGPVFTGVACRYRILSLMRKHIITIPCAPTLREHLCSGGLLSMLLHLEQKNKTDSDRNLEAQVQLRNSEVNNMTNLFLEIAKLKKYLIAFKF